MYEKRNVKQQLPAIYIVLQNGDPHKESTSISRG